MGIKNVTNFISVIIKALNFYLASHTLGHSRLKVSTKLKYIS